MPRRVPPIARIRLARSLPRLLAWPLLVTGTGVLAAATWRAGSFGTGLGGVVFAALGGVLVLIGLLAAVVLLSIRVEIQEAAVRLSWLGGERIYVLTPGPVTRVRLRGPGASRLRPRIGVFGWAIGSARLRDEEEIHVVRLARTPTAILVPTERGRLAVAAADEDQLLDALSRAARARRRLEELAATPSPEPVPEPEPEPAPAAEPAQNLPPPVVEVEPQVLTGIERALLEQQLADARAEAGAEGAPIEAEPPEAERATTAERPEGLALRGPRPSVVFVLLPLLGAGAAWAVGIASGTYPQPGTDAGRLIGLALVLAGPATSVGAIMARTWWPRLVGVVVSGGLVASAFIGRALLG
jgi:hypothetical protein